jgi:hypothetical protein
MNEEQKTSKRWTGSTAQGSLLSFLIVIAALLFTEIGDGLFKPSGKTLAEERAEKKKVATCVNEVDIVRGMQEIPPEGMEAPSGKHIRRLHLVGAEASQWIAMTSKDKHGFAYVVASCLLMHESDLITCLDKNTAKAPDGTKLEAVLLSCTRR